MIQDEKIIQYDMKWNNDTLGRTPTLPMYSFHHHYSHSRKINDFINFIEVAIKDTIDRDDL